ncbi:hypothetical protein M0R45_005552 [Rubus argutus]|uniref:PGG domain-containing protein n=1 Tax=Rubus argutus TaxID=59490 RepID=A0AAW1YN06_RUBAR
MAVLDHHHKTTDVHILERSSVFITITQLILFVSFTAATVVIQGPHEYINGAPIPTLLFKGLPCTFCAFIISIILAFSGAFSALIMFPQMENIARIIGYSSLISMASAMALLMWAFYSSSTSRWVPLPAMANGPP